MKFLVRDSQRTRHERIRSFLNDENAVIAIILAAIDLEWTIRRVIDAKRKRNDELLSDRHVSGLPAYAKAWSKTIGDDSTHSLIGIVDDWVKLKKEYQLRHEIVHGRISSIGAEFATERVELILAASKAIAAYGVENDADPYRRLKQRRVLSGPTKRK